MNVYLDTSVLLRWLLNDSARYKNFFQWKKSVASELIWIESNRALNRLRLENRISDLEFSQLHQTLSKFYKSLYVIEINAEIKKRAASPFPTIIGTLDAIHLSSALLWQEENPNESLTLLTHDSQLATAAQAYGLRTDGVVK